ncbi:MAG: InlB B-repeat-containing protein [Anaerovoracaceae bacterium]
MKKQLFTFWFIVLCTVIFSTVSVYITTDTVLADDIKISIPENSDTGDFLNPVNGRISDSLWFGNYAQSSMNLATKDPIKWRVLNAGHQNLWVISDTVLDKNKAYWPTNANGKYWENSAVRAFLNGYSIASVQGANASNPYPYSFIDQAFSINESQILHKSFVDNSVAQQAPNRRFAGGDTLDKVFLLSYSEFSNPKLFANNGARTPEATPTYAMSQTPDKRYPKQNWTRSSGVAANNMDMVQDSNPVGSTGPSRVDYTFNGVRPSVNINLSNLLFVSSVGAKNPPAALPNPANPISLDTPATIGFADKKLTFVDRNIGEIEIKHIDAKDFNDTATDANNRTISDSEVWFLYTVPSSFNGAVNKYLSAMIIEYLPGGSIDFKRYGVLSKLDTGSTATKSLTITVPAGTKKDAFNLFIFTEQLNGEGKTDFASMTKPIVGVLNFVDFEIENMDVKGRHYATVSQGYSCTLIPEKYFTIPSAIEVYVGNTELTDSDYSYNSNTGELIIYNSLITDRVLIKANALPGIYNITYHKNGGYFPDPDKVLRKYAHGTPSVLAVPKRSGYNFKGWYSKSNLAANSYVEKISEADGDDKIFYAKWTKNVILNPDPDNPNPPITGDNFPIMPTLIIFIFSIVGILSFGFGRKKNMFKN